VNDKTDLKGAAPDATLEPDLRICDPHQHLWEYPGSVYLGRALLEDIDGHNVVQTVAVEAWPRNVRDGGGLKEPWEETARAVAESKRNPGRTLIAAGIVGYADLRAGAAVEAVIAGHIRAGDGRLRGLRGAGNSVLTDAGYLEGCSAAVRHGLAIDVIVTGQQMLEVAGLADRFPDTAIIINHLGLLPLRHANQDPSGARHVHYLVAWKEIIAQLAPLENVYIKLGGLGMDLASAGWQHTREPDSMELAQVMKPWYFHCIEQFGADRCMLESNFPVDRRSFSYHVHWNAAKRLTAELSPEEREALFYGTAIRAYRL